MWNLQAAILLLGGAAAVLVVILKTQGGLSIVISEGAAAHKFSLGSWDWSWSQRTIPTVFTYGVVHYLGKFITFQVRLLEPRLASATLLVGSGIH